MRYTHLHYDDFMRHKLVPCGAGFIRHKIIFYFCITFVYFLVDVFIRNNPWYESIITVISFLFIFILFDKFFNAKVEEKEDGFTIVERFLDV